jgi:hypothetical protein
MNEAPLLTWSNKYNRKFDTFQTRNPFNIHYTGKFRYPR